MKRNFMSMATAILLSSSILFSSCIGSFSLSNKLLSWNRSIDDQWVNELIFIALAVFQVYSVSLFIDAAIMNSIEFWSGENPIAGTQTKQVETENGIFNITSDENGHKIQKEGTDEIVEFRFNKGENSWSLEAMGETTPLLQFTGENQAMVYLSDGSTMTVSTDRAGVMALRQVVENKAYFAAK